MVRPASGRATHHSRVFPRSRSRNARQKNKIIGISQSGLAGAVSSTAGGIASPEIPGVGTFPQRVPWETAYRRVIARQNFCRKLTPFCPQIYSRYATLLNAIHWGPRHGRIPPIFPGLLSPVRDKQTGSLPRQKCERNEAWRRSANPLRGIKCQAGGVLAMPSFTVWER